MTNDHGYRGIEYGVFQRDPGDWQWALYPKVGVGILTQGSINGDQVSANTDDMMDKRIKSICRGC